MARRRPCARSRPDAAAADAYQSVCAARWDARPDLVRPPRAARRLERRAAAGRNAARLSGAPLGRCRRAADEAVLSRLSGVARAAAEHRGMVAEEAWRTRGRSQ